MEYKLHHSFYINFKADRQVNFEEYEYVNDTTNSWWDYSKLTM